jgi:23S rRNA pseudouridine1911/1915/1917 synthase
MSEGKSLAERILCEDNHLLIVNKLPGEIVQADKTGDVPLSEHVKNFIKQRDHKPGNVFCGVVHRLDRPVSGAVIFAKTGKALARLNAQMQRREIRKIYWALTRYCPPVSEGELKGYFRKNAARNKSYFSPDPRLGALPGSLRYRWLKSFDRYHLLEVEPLTGRHHQIRAALAHLGCPIAGDVKYGDRRAMLDRSIALHARYLEFEHPVRHIPVKVLAPLPSDTVWSKLDFRELEHIYIFAASNLQS